MNPDSELHQKLNEALILLQEIYDELEQNPEEVVSNINNTEWHQQTCGFITDICFASKDIAEFVLGSINAKNSVEGLFKGKLGE